MSHASTNEPDGSGGNPVVAEDIEDRMRILEPFLHRNTVSLVRRFAVALLGKLRAAEHKYGYSDGWAHQPWEAECQRQLALHVQKGDPLDVAAYAAFCWQRGWRTSSFSARAREKMYGVCYRTAAPDISDYDEAIVALGNAREALLSGDGSGCRICEDGGHGANMCHHNPLLLVSGQPRRTFGSAGTAATSRRMPKRAANTSACMRQSCPPAKQISGLRLNSEKHWSIFAKLKALAPTGCGYGPPMPLKTRHDDTPDFRLVRSLDRSLLGRRQAPPLHPPAPLHRRCHSVSHGAFTMTNPTEVEATVTLPMSDEQREWLKTRIRQLTSRMRSETTGPFRQAGIYLTIQGMKAQLRDNVWRPHNAK